MEAIKKYSLAWSTASAFFVLGNGVSKRCHPTNIASLFNDELLRLRFQYANHPTVDGKLQLVSVAREIKDMCRNEVAYILDEIDTLLVTSV
ncbi:hypothetical protein D3C78_1522990 [compost metagenome]